MARWIYINGVVSVYVFGRTQPENRYILETVLEHLPNNGADVYVIQKNGYSSSSSHDEFDKRSNLGKGDYGYFDIQSEYLLTIDGNLYAETFEEGVKVFMKWLCRLAKRVGVEDCLVKIHDYNKSTIIKHSIALEKMWEDSSMYDGGHEERENWCDYLMWRYPKDEDGHYITGKPSVKNRKKS